MKIIALLFIAFLFVCSSFAQKVDFPIDKLSGRANYTGIVNLPGCDKQSIYTAVSNYLLSTAVPMDRVFEHLDYESGIITAYRWMFAYSAKGFSIGYIRFIVIINVSDESFSYSVTNLIFDPYFEYDSYSRHIENEGKYTCKFGKKDWFSIRYCANRDANIFAEKLKSIRCN